MKKQDGLALPVTLTLFLVIVLGALYLARSSFNASLAAGNMAYQRVLSRAADLGLFAANDWLGSTHESTKSLLDADQSAQGYVASYAFASPPITPEDSAFWAGSVTVNNIDGNGTNVQYVTYRMCSLKSSFYTTGNNCVTSSPNTASQAGATVGASLDLATGQSFNDMPLIHYLITARVTNGGRGTTVTNQLVVMMGP
jgi:hypothetical protein